MTCKNTAKLGPTSAVYCPTCVPATPRAGGGGGGAQLSVLRESCDATSIASGTARVAAVISWMLPPACPVTTLREVDPSGLMGSWCELLSCVDAPSASLHSCKVSSRTKRGISTRGTPALATWASEKARCGAGGARTFPCERAVCRCPRCACRPATRSRQLSHSSFTLCTHPSAATTCTTCGDPHTTVLAHT
jgi:hypothetical protein